MSARPLLDQLFRDADAEVARRLAAARADAARIEAEAAATLAAERHEALHVRAVALGAALERERSERDRRRDRELLAARRRLVDRALDRALQRAPDLVGRPGTAPALQRILHGALAYLPDGDATVRCHPLVVPALESTAASIVADEAIAFGFVAESRDGRVRVDATLSTLIARAREAVSIALVRQHTEQRP